VNQVYVLLTKGCNLKCFYCIRDYSVKNNDRVSLENFDYIFKEILKNFPPTVQLILSGGEPTILENFHEVLALASQYFENILINSNGTTNYFLTNSFYSLLEHTSKMGVQISIDGDSVFHDLIRGEGSFNKSISTIENLSKINGCDVIISTTVTSTKFKEEFLPLQSELIKYGFKKWNIKRVSYAGRAKDSNHYLSTENWNTLVEYIEENKSQKNIFIQKQFDFKLLDTISDKQLEELNVMKNCGSGTQKIYIYPNLDVLACTCYEKSPSGNLNESSLEEILKSTAHQSIITDTINNKICNSCRYKLKCNGGCLGSGYSSVGMLGVADHKCPKIIDNV